MSTYRCRNGRALFTLVATTAVTCAVTAVGAAEASHEPASPVAAPTATASPAAANGVADPCGGSARLLATLNRPTVGYSACAVPKGAIVLEDGYQNQAQGGTSPSVTTTYPQGFQRVGIADRLELDLIGPAYNRQRSGASVTTGYSDLGLGFKYELPQAGRFTYAVDGLFQASTGSGGFGAGGPTSAIDVDVAYAASPAIGFGTTLAGYATGGAGARYGYFLPSVVVTAQIPNSYQFYAELVGQTKLAPDRGGRIFTDFGVQKLLGPFLEVDGEYGISFTPVDGSRFRYVGVGLGLRVK